MFLTLGNFAVDSRASLAVLDFERTRLLSISGSARLEFDADDPQHATGGTRRFWDLEVREWIEFELAPNVGWELVETSPFNPRQSPK
jgi:hypothetical protein